MRKPATGVWDSATAWRVVEELRLGTREGAGPGELKDAIGMDWDGRGHLRVADPGNGRYSVFDTAGELVTTHRRRRGDTRSRDLEASTRTGVCTKARRTAASAELNCCSSIFDSLLEPVDTFPIGGYELEHLNELRRDGGLALEPAILRGTLERVRPILMTTATTIGGMLPLVLFSESPDANIWNALGYALIGGLAGSTLFVLTVTPALYVLVQGRSQT